MSPTEPADGRGTAQDATVSTAPHDTEARRALLKLAESMDDGEAKGRILAMAETFMSPAESLSILADDAEKAAEDIGEKIKGMEATRKQRLADAKEFRAQANKLED